MRSLSTQVNAEVLPSSSPCRGIPQFVWKATFTLTPKGGYAMLSGLSHPLGLLLLSISAAGYEVSSIFHLH